MLLSTQYDEDWQHAAPGGARAIIDEVWRWERGGWQLIAATQAAKPIPTVVSDALASARLYASP